MRSFLPLTPAMANPWLFFSLLFFFFFVSVAKEQGEFRSPYFSRLYEIHEQERRPASVQETAVHGLLLRLLPSHASSFQFRIISKEKCNGKVCFIIRNHPSGNLDASPEIIIEGVTGVEISAGLHWYLKYFCSAHISWEKTGGAQLNTVPKPGSLPPVPHDRICVQRPIEWSYYQNAVASSYSFAWWDWERWEKEIDWMALQGINLPLAFTGQEAIWQKVLQKFNFSTSDLDDFFGGPAFLAWSRMSNLHGWGGPLPQTWLNFQLVLQKKILERMYDFGMTPVLPAFSGNVPAAIKSRFPNARVTQLGNWFSVNSNTRWCCTYLLDPTDPLFVNIGRSFIEQQIKEYGRSSHIYNCDTFDENTPPSDNPHYISSLGAAIYKGMQSGDSDAVWLMQTLCLSVFNDALRETKPSNLFNISDFQGWLFSYDPFWKPPQMKALLHSVPIGRMVVLDLYAEVKPIWCMLHNFAANNEMYGVLEAVALEPIKARSSYNSTMIGVGMCMEGIEQNPVVYDLMSEMAFRHDPVDVEEWLHLYSTRRYGKQIKGLQYAWKILLHTLYNCTDGAYNKNRDVIVAFPDVEPSVILKEEKLHKTCAGNNFLVQKLAEGNLQDDTSDVTYEKPHIWYSTADVVHALQIFLENGDEVSDIPTFRYDLVDLTRQALAKYANEVFLKALEGYGSNDLTKVNFHSQHFLELVEDLDTLLASHDGFLLGPWLESAKNLATGSDQTEQFEWNARTQITMWYDNLETKASLLRDYGNKYWSGLLRDYYGPRAKIYVECLLYSMQTGESFPLQDWRRDWINLTNSWQKSKEVYPIKATGSAYNISHWIFDKYLSGTGSYLRHELSSSSF